MDIHFQCFATTNPTAANILLYTVLAHTCFSNMGSVDRAQCNRWAKECARSKFKLLPNPCRRGKLALSTLPSCQRQT